MGRARNVQGPRARIKLAKSRVRTLVKQGFRLNSETASNVYNEQLFSSGTNREAKTAATSLAKGYRK